MIVHIVRLSHELGKFAEKECYYDEHYEADEAFIALLSPFLELVLWELASLYDDSIMCLYPKVLLAEVSEI